MISDTKMPIPSSGCFLFSFRKEEGSCGCDLLSEEYPPADDGFSGLRKMISAGCSLPEQITIPFPLFLMGMTDEKTEAGLFSLIGPSAGF